MSFSLATPTTIQTTKIKISQINILFDEKQMRVTYEKIGSGDVRVGIGSVVLNGQDFTDFYDAWSTHAGLYTKVSELAGIAGTYAADEDLS